MPKSRTVTSEQLTPNATILVQGRIVYCRIRSQVAGEELARRNQQNIARGMSPRTNPYTTVQICNANVIKSDPNAPMLTPEETFVLESMYTSANPEHAGMNYQAYNSGQYLPRLCVRDGAAVNELAPEQIEGELANGLLVTLVLRTFASRQGYNKKGISLDMVICDEPIRYWGGTANLSKYGLTANLSSTRQAANPAAAPAAAPAGYVQPASYPAQPAVQPAGYAQPAQPAGYPPQTAPAGYPAQPAVQPAVQTQPAQPAVQTQPAQPAPGPMPYTPGADMAPFGFPGGTPAGAPTPASPYAGQPGAGITYDPNAPDRGY